MTTQWPASTWVLTSCVLGHSNGSLAFGIGSLRLPCSVSGFPGGTQIFARSFCWSGSLEGKFSAAGTSRPSCPQSGSQQHANDLRYDCPTPTVLEHAFQTQRDLVTGHHWCKFCVGPIALRSALGIAGEAILQAALAASTYSCHDNQHASQASVSISGC